MEAPRNYRADAIVLHRVDTGETDRIVILYTRAKGKIAGIAKGARKALSKLGAATEPFTFGRYMLAVGQNLDVITQVETRESFQTIRKDMERVAYAIYFVELVDAFVEEREANYDIFDTLLSALYMLESGILVTVVARSFELKLLDLLGYGPQLDSCLRCEAVPSGDEVTYSPCMGGLVCSRCGPLPEDTLYLRNETVQVLKLLSMAEPSDLRRLQLAAGVGKEVARTLHSHIRYRLERDLKSMEFLQSLAVVAVDEKL